MNPAAHRPETKEIFRNILLVFGVLLLPGLHMALLGWLSALTPLLVFYYLCRHGENVGGRYLIIGTLLALAGGLVGQRTSAVFIALTFFPTGYILARSAQRPESPGRAGLKAGLMLCGSWFLVASMIALTEDSSPYGMLLQSIDQAMDEALQAYQDSGQLPLEASAELAAIFLQIQTRLIQLLPAILISAALSVVWMTMVLGNRLLFLNQGQSPWPAYQHWRLPEKFVWVVIAAALLTLFPATGSRTAGLNVLLVCTLIYGFQGLSVVLFFFNKWNVPLFLRSLLYLILIFQTVGSVILSVIGIADVWLNFRQKNNQDAGRKDTNLSP